MARKPKNPVPRRKIGERTETIDVKLTQVQIEDERAKVIDILQSKDELEEKLSSIKADYKAKLAELDSQKATALGMIRSGRTRRDVVIEEWVDDRNEVVRIDKETGEELGRRTATARELQEELPIDLDPTEGAAEGAAGEADLEKEESQDADPEDGFGDEEA